MAITHSRTRLRFDDGWLFHAGDVPAPIANTHLAGYMANKAGYARGAARGNFDDSDWQPVTLPHDWSVDGPFSKDNHVNSGFLPRGVGWYRRHFRLDEADRGRVVRIHFDAIASHAQVFVNGHLLARSFNGYLPVEVDLSDVATYGDELNTVAVRVDATPMEGWWYEGAGIYRHVWLTKRSSIVSFDDDSLRIDVDRTTAGGWRVAVNGWFTSHSRKLVDAVYRCRLIDPDGTLIATFERPCFTISTYPFSAQALFEIASPKLWDVDSPNLYRVECELIFEGDVVDAISSTCGLRAVAFVGSALADHSLGAATPRSAEADPTQTAAEPGFYLNGRRVFLKGACVHQDHAGVGVAVPDSIHRFRVQRLKDMGCNAVRIGHHPPAPEFLDACDELGLLVMDENRTFGSSPEHLAQLRAMVRRDYNHPSVILWSVCNEEAIQGTPTARNITATMANEIRRLDTTRPITAAISGGLLNDNATSEPLAVVGINYNFATLDAFHEKFPSKAVFSSETGCTLATRGTYETDAAKCIFADYDDEHERWGSTAREAWKQVSTRPWLAGMFVWTGFDYRGEPSPHVWPSVTSHWGLMDLCGFEKDAFWRHKAWFGDESVLHLLPHWNWTAGETVRVQAVTNADEIELFVNGRSLGRKPRPAYDFPEWHVPFEPGELKAIAYVASVEVATAVRETTGPAVSLGIELHPSAEATNVADGETAWPLTVFALDSDGRRVPTAEPECTITIDGPAELIGVGNGDPNGHFANRGPTLPLFRGLAQAIVRAGLVAGEITVRARSRGLGDGVMTFTTIAVQPRPTVPTATRRWFLNDWLMGPITPTPPDVSAAVAGTDMNTWERIKAGGPQTAWSSATGFAIYRATLKPPKAMAGRGGRLVFSAISGTAEVFVDGVKQAAGLTIELPPRSTPAAVVVRLKGEDAAAGITGPVELIVG